MRDFNVIDKWIEEERKKHAIAHERRMKIEAMRRVFMRYKRFYSYSEYVLNSVYTYSSAGVLMK